MPCPSIIIILSHCLYSVLTELVFVRTGQDNSDPVHSRSVHTARHASLNSVGLCEQVCSYTLTDMSKVGGASFGLDCKP
ncbi:hypothetical protein FN846DRAFT_980053 [Sphaerosporella brunnea]|uniref:Secreted protein n=1 Tax=Sphaerosporella brunnea TaxID=1250544 RepID=A0A5J5ED74_9PEZI|nr:hypothetical protein FN846DRAFT_980053 [Sphaerosporella brunnea]